MVETAAQRSARLRRFRESNPGYSTSKNKEWQKANPEKRRAHRAVEYALKTGKLKRGCCEQCGTDQNIEAHHDDYSKPLLVRWLCRKHHRMLDTLFRH